MKYLWIVLLLLLTQRIDAHNIAVSRISSLEQLPVNAIHRIFQDSEGYMWYGTVNGLCRDDGYQVRVFRSDIRTPGLLDNNLVECIAEDKEGKIWFGTDKGGYFLDKKDYRITTLDAVRLKNKFVYRIDVTSDGYVWVSVWGYLLKYKANGKLEKEYLVRNGGQDTCVGGFCEARDGTLIVTFNGGLIYHLDKTKDKFIPFPEGLKRNNPTVLIQDKDHPYFWVSTWGDGLVRFDPSAIRDSMYVYQPLPMDSQGRTTGIILFLAQDNESGYIWGTSSHDLVAYEQNYKGMLKQVSLAGLLPPSNRMLNDLVKDRWGNLWVSAFDQPSFIIHFGQNMPKGYPMPALRKKVNSNPAIMSLVDSDNGVMWISQERTGVCLYDLNADRMSCYLDFFQTKNLNLAKVKEMSESRTGNGVWVVPEGSLLAYRLQRKGMEMKLRDKIDLSPFVKSGHIRKVLENAKGDRLWIGTSTGLYTCGLKNMEIRKANGAMGYVTAMLESEDGTMWFATNDNGLHRMRPTGEWQHYTARHSFSSISISSDGTLWLGTEEGTVLSFQPKTDEWKDFGGICGTNGDQVNQVLVDVFNHVWIDMNQKIIEFNPRNGSFRTYLTTDEGMLLWRLIPTAICKGKDGSIYFGGIPGICSVTPSNRLESGAHPIKTFITNVTSMGHSFMFGEKTKEGGSLSAIVLEPDDRYIKIYFSSLNHRFAHKIRYAYRLKGVDRDWVYTANGANSAFYNQIPKGDHLFQVKATDENGLWSDEVTEFTIHRLPAFYETWWAYLIYITAIVCLLLAVLSWYAKKIKRKSNEMWADSAEMMKIRGYLDSEVNLPDAEYAQLDKLLLDKAIKTVEGHLTEPDFDVTALAEAMNMSRSTLTRKLKTITGRTPLEFIRNIKMKHACRLLEDKSRSVSEVSVALGYFNRKYFTACFKEEFGMTPSEYQKSLS